MSADRPRPRYRSMTCRAVQERLPLVPGADLRPEEDQSVRLHLAACAHCRRELGAYLRARRALRTVASTPLPRFELVGSAGSADNDAFFTRLQRDTLHAVHRDARRRQRRRESVPARRSVAGIMTAVALFLLGVYLVPMWLPERTPWTEMQPIVITSPDPASGGGASPARFRNLGYGLSGHRPMLRLELAELPVLVDGPGPHPETIPAVGTPATPTTPPVAPVAPAAQPRPELADLPGAGFRGDDRASGNGRR